MLHRLILFLLQIYFTAIGSLLVLRAWVQWRGLVKRDPLRYWSEHLTQWCVGGLRRLWGSKMSDIYYALIAAALMAWINLTLVYWISNYSGDWLHLPATALLVFKWGVQLLSWFCLLLALGSWISPGSAALKSLDALLLPFVQPIRARLPLIKGLDLSLWLLFLAAQCLVLLISAANL